jgi:GWxTD domain-containing protein
MVPATLAACVSASPGLDRDRGPGYAHLETTLEQYRARGFLAGTLAFPVVGRAFLLPGPGDSAWLGFAASTSPSALRFSRDEALFAARYQVRIVAVDADGDTVRRAVDREVVRVDDFPETASDREKIFYQRFVTVPAGRLEVEVTVRELASRREVTRRFALEWPDPRATATGGLAEPVAAFRAAPRTALDQSPPMIAAPRNTLAEDRGELRLVVEAVDDREGGVEVVVYPDSGRVALWSDTAVLARSGSGPATAVLPVPPRRLPPGLVRVELRRAGAPEARVMPLLVALSDEWATADFDRAVDWLRWAVSDDSLSLWKTASPAERARLWTGFFDATDPDPSTPANEFFATWFGRMSEASRLYDEAGVAGWRTDRGRAYVLLGPPDHEEAQRPTRQDEPPRIAWSWDASLPFPVRLVFENSDEFGSFELDQRSRLVLRRAWERLRAEADREREMREGEVREPPLDAAAPGPRSSDAAPGEAGSGGAS